MLSGVIKSGQLSLIFSIALACSPPKDWKTMDMNERLKLADIVVYGEVGDVPALPTNTLDHTLLNYTFSVLCVLKKGNQSITNSLTIRDEYPTADCVSDRHWMVKGDKIVVMLSEQNNGFHFNNINVQTAVFSGNSVQNISSCSGIANAVGSQCPSIQAVGTDICSSASAPSSHLMPFLALAILICQVFYKL